MFDKLLRRMIRRIQIDDGCDGWDIYSEAHYIRAVIAKDGICVGLGRMCDAITELEAEKTRRRARRFGGTP